MHLELRRDAVQRYSYCTFGQLLIGELVLETIERPWLDNQKAVSCVPKGTYELVPHNSERHPHTLALVNPVLGVIHYEDMLMPQMRSEILIHSANKASELLGCIAPGLVRSTFNGIAGVAQSRLAMEKFNSLVPWVNGHTLTII